MKRAFWLVGAWLLVLGCGSRADSGERQDTDRIAVRDAMADNEPAASSDDVAPKDDNVAGPAVFAPAPDLVEAGAAGDGDGEDPPSSGVDEPPPDSMAAADDEVTADDSSATGDESDVAGEAFVGEGSENAPGAAGDAGAALDASSAEKPVEPVEPVEPPDVPVVECGAPTLDEDGNAFVSLSEANNYAFSSWLSFTPTPVRPNANLTFDWSDATRDLLGHAVDPSTDIDMVMLALWRLSPSDLEVKLNADELAQSDLVNIFMVYPDVLREAHPEEMGTSAQLLRVTDEGERTDMTLFENPLLPEEVMPLFDPEVYDPAGHVWTMIASRGTVAGEGTTMIQTFQPTAGATNAEVRMTAESTSVDYEVDLRIAPPLSLFDDVPSVIDWGDMQVTAMGTEFVTRSVGEVIVARYDQTPAQLESQFSDLELLAQEMYRAEVPAGTEFELRDSSDENGVPFAGLDRPGTWLLMLRCTSCRNPAPWYLTQLARCAQ